MAPRWRFVALWATFLISALTAGTVIAAPPPALRVALGLAMTLVLPGFGVLSAAVPNLRMSRVESTVAVCGISLASDICCGLLLGATPIGLSSASLTVALGGATAVAAAVAILRMLDAGEVSIEGWQLRERRPSRSPASAVSRDSSLFDPPQWQSWIAVVACASALLLAAAAVIGSDRSALSAHGPGYAAISTVPVSASRIRIEVTSHELDTRKFRVSVEAGTVIVARWPSVRLRPGQSWTRVMSLPTAAPRTKVQAELFVGQSTAPYQKLFFFLG